MASSSIPRLKAALVDRLEAAEWPGSRPGVAYGWPKDVPRETVMVGGTIDSEQTWVAFGARRRDETYRLRVTIQVIGPGLTQRAVTERAFALLAVLEDVLRAEPDLGLGSEVTVAEIAQPQLLEAPEADGHAAVINTGVAVRGRI